MIVEGESYSTRKFAVNGTSGQWAVASGQWLVGSGQWEVGSGQWLVGSGQWHVTVESVATLVEL